MPKFLQKPAAVGKPTSAWLWTIGIVSVYLTPFISISFVFEPSDERPLPISWSIAAIISLKRVCSLKLGATPDQQISFIFFMTYTVWSQAVPCLIGFQFFKSSSELLSLIRWETPFLSSKTAPSECHFQDCSTEERTHSTSSIPIIPETPVSLRNFWTSSSIKYLPANICSISLRRRSTEISFFENGTILSQAIRISAKVCAERKPFVDKKRMKRKARSGSSSILQYAEPTKRSFLFFISIRPFPVGSSIFPFESS